MTSLHKENKVLLVIGRADIDKITFIIVVQHFQYCRVLKQEQFQYKNGHYMLMMQIGWLRLIVNHLTAIFQVSQCNKCEICWHWYSTFLSALQTVAKCFSPKYFHSPMNNLSKQGLENTQKIYLLRRGNYWILFIFAISFQ